MICQILVLLGISVFSGGMAEASQSNQAVELYGTMSELFSHRKHEKAFSSMGVACTDCHSFNIKPKVAGPLAPPVDAKLLSAPKGVCHSCHLSKVTLPVPSNCLLCHLKSEALMPKDHHLNWQKRHGQFAQMNQQSCTQCHSESSCSDCHMKRDFMNPKVHGPNFRFTHSIQARGNPQSCIQCHKAQSFCVDCHTGSRK